MLDDRGLIRPVQAATGSVSKIWYDWIETGLSEGTGSGGGIQRFEAGVLVWMLHSTWLTPEWTPPPHLRPSFSSTTPNSSMSKQSSTSTDTAKTNEYKAGFSARELLVKAEEQNTHEGKDKSLIGTYCISCGPWE